MSEKLSVEDMYLAYKDKITYYVRSKVNNPSDAEDIVSKVFLKVVEKFDTFDESKAAFSTWIYTVTGNTIIDYDRVQKPSTEIDETFSYVDNGFENITNEETLEELADALEKLDERSRSIIILHYYSGLSLKDIAIKMVMSYANVKIVRSKAVKLLSEYMKCN